MADDSTFALACTRLSETYGWTEREALRWYATLAETSTDGLTCLAPAESRQAEMLERLGDRAGAVAHYQRFLELWREADPEFASWVAHARGRLQALERSGDT